MNNEDKIRDYFDRLTDNKVKLSSNDWIEFEKEFKLHKKKKRLRYFAFLSIILSGLFFAGYFLVINNKFAEKENLHFKDTTIAFENKSQENGTSILSGKNKLIPENRNSITSNNNEVTPKVSDNRNFKSIESNQSLLHGADQITDNESNKGKINQSLSDATIGSPVTFKDKYNIKSDPLKKYENSIAKVSDQTKNENKFLNDDSLVVRNGINPDSNAQLLPNETINESSGKKGSLYFRLSISTDYTFNKSSVADGAMTRIHEDYPIIKGESENGKFAYTIGANLVYYKGKFSFQSGLIYTKINIGGKYDYQNDKIPVIDGKTGNIYGYITGVDTVKVYQEINNTYSFIEFPVILGYRKDFVKKMSIYIKGGPAILFLLNAKGHTITTDQLELTNIAKMSYNKFNMGIIFSPGYSIQVNDKFDIFIEPTYKRFVNSILSEESNEQSKPYSIGINMGIQLRLK